jgi:nucleotide-binding universal stress UspA family protein
MIRSILVALDGSEHAYAALDAALVIARPSKAEVRPVFVDDTSIRQRTVWTVPGLVMDPGFRPDISANIMQLQKTTRETIGRIRKEINKRAKGKRLKLHIVEGDPVEALLAESMTVDLVAMGRSSYAADQGPIKLGTVTRQLVRKSPDPILVAQEGPTLKARFPILVPYSGSHMSNRALKDAARIGRALKARLDVIVVKDKKAEAKPLLDEARRYLSAQQVRSTFNAIVGRPDEKIVTTAKKKRSGLIVMGAYGHGALTELLLGSTAERVIDKTACTCVLSG